MFKPGDIIRVMDSFHDSCPNGTIVTVMINRAGYVKFLNPGSGNIVEWYEGRFQKTTAIVEEYELVETKLF